MMEKGSKPAPGENPAGITETEGLNKAGSEAASGASVAPVGPSVPEAQAAPRHAGAARSPAEPKLAAPEGKRVADGHPAGAASRRGAPLRAEPTKASGQQEPVKAAQVRRTLAAGEARGSRPHAGKERSRRPLKPALASILLAVAAYSILFFMIAATISPERYDLRVGEVASRTITASKDVEDTITTGKLVDAAVREVQPSYQSDESVMPEALGKMEDSFAQLRALNQLRVGLDGTVSPISEETLQKARQALRPVEMTDEALTAALDATDGTLARLAEEAVSLARETLNAKVAEGQEAESAERIRQDLLSADYGDALSDAAAAIVSTYLRANLLIDAETTEQKREAAKESVEPVVYKKGQNIVRAGEVVTAPQIEMLNSLGMLKDRAVDLSLYLGVALLLLLLAVALITHIYRFMPEMLVDPRRVALLCVILVLVAGISMGARLLDSYLMPVALGAMLTTLLLKSRLALIVNVILSILTGILASVDNGIFTATVFGVTMTSLVSGAMVAPVLRDRQSRSGIVFTGLIVIIADMLTTVAIGLFNSANLQNVMTWALWAGGSGLLSTMLTIGLAPLLEWAFNLVTPSKLLELSNPNQPLLRRLLLETPGTYHHSILVANLAEAAASAVGANALLARVGAYYHDIGKLRRPMYFKENQMNDNPHDRTDPRVSTAILTAHPRDGVEMAIKARLPEEIQKIIRQHHGDSPVLYFYDKAVKQGMDVDVSDFRYEGPRPDTREAAIVMLADIAEAAARAAAETTPEKMEALIRKLIHGKLEDGQLDDCPLMFSDLTKITEAFLTVLTGVYHDRIEYPEVTIPERTHLEKE